jgi:2-dehydropantoate 2-reductase
MRFLIVGPGAMGCLFGARLKRAGFDVTLLDYNRERTELLNRQGISIEGVSGEYTEMVPSMVYEIGDGFDFVLLCVKSNKTRIAAEFLKTKLALETTIVTLQNGVGNLEILEEIFGKERALGGVTAEGATALGWGRIRHAGVGATIVGPRGTAGGPAEKLVDALNKAGF